MADPSVSVEAMRSLFGPIVKTLNASDWVPGNDDVLGIQDDAAGSIR